MKKEEVKIPDEEVLSDNTQSDEPAIPKKSKPRRFWEYVTDYKRKTVALTLPSIIFDIAYSGFLFAMSVLTLSIWLLIMSLYTFLLFLLRVNVLYRAGRGAVFKEKRFSERRNYRKFSRNLIFLDLLIAFNVYIIVELNVLHDYHGILIYAFGIYVAYKCLLAIINMFKAHKSQSLTAVSLRKIGITDALISLLALEWALSHRDIGNLSLIALKIEKYSGIAVVLIIFLMGFAGAITCIRLKAKEKKEGKL